MSKNPWLAPLPIIEPGKYFDLDSKPLWVPRQIQDNSAKKDNRISNGVSNTSERLQEEKKETTTTEANEPERHTCLPDENKRCCECGISMEPLSYVQHPSKATYKTASDLKYTMEVERTQYQTSRASDKLGVQTFYMTKTIEDLRNYMLYLLDSGDSGNPVDISELWQKRMIGPNCINDCMKFQQQNVKEALDPGILQFHGNFECANIERAVMKSSTEYDIYSRVDTNTNRHLRWFYFAVSNAQAGQVVKFTIKNMIRQTPLLNSGMKVKVRSSNIYDGEWTYNGIDDVTYYKNLEENRVFYVKVAQKNNPVGTCFKDDKNEESDDEGAMNANGDKDDGTNGMYRRRVRPFSCLSFKYTFPEHTHPAQKFYFSFSPPYSYSDMTQFIKQIETTLEDRTEVKTQQTGPKVSFTTKDNIFYQREQIGHSLAGLPILMLTITNECKSSSIPIKRRKAVIITARVHASEVPSSLVLEGIIQFLIGPSPQASHLRNLFIFYLVPILNPDGVIAGNSRTAVGGHDLNRMWQKPTEEQHPEIFFTKKKMAQIASEREILLYLDLHGHSAKTNAFMYGCNKAADGGFTSWTKVRLLPRIMAGRSHRFSLRDCRFKVQPWKEGSARVVVWKEFKVTNSFTLEVSLYGFDFGDSNNAKKEFTPEELRELGVEVMESLLEYTYLLSKLKYEMMLNGGWLKPNMLLAVTGTPAMDLMAKKMAEESKHKRRTQKAASVSSMGTFSSSGKQSAQEDWKYYEQIIQESEALRKSINVSMKDNWREYFGEKELQDNYDKIQNGKDPNDEEKDGDSGASSEEDDEVLPLDFTNLTKSRLANHTPQQSLQPNNSEKDRVFQTKSLIPQDKNEKASLTSTLTTQPIRGGIPNEAPKPKLREVKATLLGATTSTGIAGGTNILPPPITAGKSNLIKLNKSPVLKGVVPLKTKALDASPAPSFVNSGSLERSYAYKEPDHSRDVSQRPFDNGNHGWDRSGYSNFIPLVMRNITPKASRGRKNSEISMLNVPQMAGLKKRQNSSRDATQLMDRSEEMSYNFRGSKVAMGTPLPLVNPVQYTEPVGYVDEEMQLERVNHRPNRKNLRDPSPKAVIRLNELGHNGTVNTMLDQLTGVLSGVGKDDMVKKIKAMNKFSFNYMVTTDRRNSMNTNNPSRRVIPGGQPTVLANPIPKAIANITNITHQNTSKSPIFNWGY